MKKSNYKIKVIALLLIISMVSLPVYSVNAQSKSELIVSFYPLGAEGDSFIIDFGDYEILVDAGANKNSAKTIVENMNKYCDDGVWEMIIATHPDHDHIAEFATSGGVFDQFKQKKSDKNKFKLEYFIDFDFSMDNTVKFTNSNGKDVTEEKCNNLFSTKEYQKYKAKRDKIVKASEAKYYTASQCCWEQRGLASNSDVNGATNTFVLSKDNDPNAPVLTILYNYYYDHLLNVENKITPDDKNILSVCFMIEYQGEVFLFTGDLEEYSSLNNNKDLNGEDKLLEYNPQLCNGVTFYKAAHHGSLTSSSEAFIDSIRPQYVVISVVAGSDRYTSDESKQLPAPKVLERLFKYTDKIYITELTKEDTVVDYYGDIKICCSEAGVTVETEQLNGVLLHHTDWFRETRDTVLSTFVFDLPVLPNGDAGNWHCVLVKYGSVDILIDCGIYINNGADTSLEFVDKLKRYCIDGVLDYVIVTSARNKSISQMIGNLGKGNGVLDSFKILNLIDFGENTNMSVEKDGEQAWLKSYVEKRDQYLSNGSICNYNNSSFYKIEDDFTLQVFNAAGVQSKNEADYSLCTLITFKGKKLLFTGDLSNSNRLINEAGQKISNVTFYVAGGNGSAEANSKELLSTIRPEYIVIPAAAGLVESAKNACNTFIVHAKKHKGEDTKRIYLMGEYKDNAYHKITGDITFQIIGERTSLKGEKALPKLQTTEWYKQNFNK